MHHDAFLVFVLWSLKAFWFNLFRWIVYLLNLCICHLGAGVTQEQETFKCTWCMKFIVPLVLWNLIHNMCVFHTFDHTLDLLFCTHFLKLRWHVTPSFLHFALLDFWPQLCKEDYLLVSTYSFPAFHNSIFAMQGVSVNEKQLTKMSRAQELFHC